MTDTPTSPTTMTGDQFAQGLKLLGWRQVEFADRAGVAPDTVNRWVHDRQPIPTWAQRHLALLLAAAEFHRAYVAPPPRTRRKAAGDTADGDDA